jgi:Lrp/AsnC family transcriptional regulator for asnA, asnC and gidA
MARFDSADEKIIGLLRTNGRRTNADLARQLGVTEGAIRKKLRKLTSEGVLKVAAVADPQKLGYAIDVLSGVQVSPRQTQEVAKHLVSWQPPQHR